MVMAVPLPITEKPPTGHRSWIRRPRRSTLPLPDQTAQQAALASLLPQLNASQVEVFSVFTAPGVQLINCSGLNCFTSVSLLEKLQSSSADCTGPLQPRELGTALEAMKPDPPAKTDNNNLPYVRLPYKQKLPPRLFHFS